MMDTCFQKFFPGVCRAPENLTSDRITYQQEMMSGLFYGAYILASLPFAVKRRLAVQKPIALMSCQEAARDEAIDTTHCPRTLFCRRPAFKTRKSLNLYAMGSEI